MLAPDPPSPSTWRKSTHSNGAGGDCIEVARTRQLIALRDSKSPNIPYLTFSPKLWKTFLANVKQGRHDVDR
ncbi:DUF397 domain-containing protein [Actinocorallia populi]|uniref:DUF397 domain-containing protein n=1 Tax=Actinocorallia populi TaxID=2079200 RepID=UPI000D08F69C|nr:DUF397 domain-containing protein [Actinocorallia populi]